ncbi:LPS export ABC transporter periplasmic protein LptC [Zoogloea sp.]|uniref:LPS export ABC transporter periplasmic protein LptC n=1 Tax=Zoogloea sp. TaxID=49181 RepID=UPI0035AE72E8
MNGRGHSLFPLVVLILLAGVSIWLERSTSRDARPQSGQIRHEPDFSIDKFTLHRFDQTGKTQYILRGDRLVHFLDDETSEVTRPRLEYLNRPEPMHLESEKATVNKEGDVVVLTDKVYARRAPYQGKPESTLNTERMTIWPDDEKMRTETPVTLTQGQTVITADRMDTHSLSGEIRLQGRVKGILYRSSQTPPKP